jgi:hypothetical protein
MSDPLTRTLDGALVSGRAPLPDALASALEAARDLGTERAAIHAGERLADAITTHLPPLTSLSRTPIAPMWLEPWAACAPLQRTGPTRLVRTATIARTPRGLACIDPALPEAFAATPLGERMASLHHAARETFPLTLRMAVGPPEHFTEIVFTDLRFQALRALLGTTHGDGLEPALPPWFAKARVYVSALDWARYAHPDALPTEERAALARGGLARLRTDAVVFVDRPLVTDAGLVVVPTGGLTPGALTVAMPVRDGRIRVAVATSQATTRDAYSPYESALPGLREHARLRDTDVAPRGDALDQAAHLRALRFERALADRDPKDPRFHDVLPSTALHVGSRLHAPVGSRTKSTLTGV